MNGIKIEGIEFFVPETTLSSLDLQKEFPSFQPKKVEEKIGIKQRHIASSDQTAVDLAYEAGERLLRRIDRSEVDFLLLCTQTPEYILPTSACILQDRLGLRQNIGALDFNLGCSGYVYGLSLAKGLIAAGVAESVLLITSDTYSKLIHEKDKGNRAIFGDGAAATYLKKNTSNYIHNFVLGTDGSGHQDIIIKNGGAKHCYNPEAPLLNYGNQNGYSDNTLYMNGPKIYNFVVDRVPQLIMDTLAKNDLEIDQIDHFVFHQANKSMLQYLCKRLEIDKSKFYINLENTANTVSSTIPIALADLMKTQRLKSGDKLLLAGFGVGLSWGATVVEV